jgi:hypothetical protein
MRQIRNAALLAVLMAMHLCGKEERMIEAGSERDELAIERCGSLDGHKREKVVADRIAENLMSRYK